MNQFRCPTCRRPSAAEGNPHRPFCSERCRLKDLGNWASERYRIPGPPADAETNRPAENGDEDSD